MNIENFIPDPEIVRVMVSNIVSGEGNWTPWHVASLIAQQLDVPIQQIFAAMPSSEYERRPMIYEVPPDLWPQIRDEEITGDGEVYMPVKIHQPKILLGRMAQALANTISFPVNTAFAHALGCVASAAVWNFTYRINSKYRTEYDQPVNLFIVSSQPPSTGKSGVHKALTKQIHEDFKRINKNREIDRARILSKISELEDDIKKGGGFNEKKESHLYDLREKLQGLGQIIPLISDATAEALDSAAAAHNGIVNVVSDEAESIENPIGGMYSAGGKRNLGILLALWDNGPISSLRITRVGHKGSVKGCFSVIAQDSAIDTILEAGKTGRGISERFLIMKELDLLGTRDKKKSVPMDEKVQSDYNQMISALLSEEDGVQLEIDNACFESILDYCQGHEEQMGAGERFENNMLRGVIGKADKQICKLASIIHCSEEWAPGGKRSTKIKPQYVGMAIQIFDQFKDAYIQVTEKTGVAGDMAFVSEAYKTLMEIKERRKRGVFTINQITTSSQFRGRDIFKSTPQPTKKMRDMVMPVLVSAGVCAFDGKTIWINPNL